MKKANENKEISLTFYTPKDLRNWDTGKKVLSFFLEYDQSLAAEFVEFDHGLQAVNIKDYDYLSSSWGNSLVFILHRRSPYRNQTSISLVKNKSGYHLIYMWVEADYFHNQVNIDRFINFGEKLYEAKVV